jgi:hypothetical protein
MTTRDHGVEPFGSLRVVSPGNVFEIHRVSRKQHCHDNTIERSPPVRALPSHL